MGPGFVSPNLDTDLLDGMETVDIDSAEAEVRRLAREEGILVGQSSAASNLAARRVARRLADGGSHAAGDCPTPDNGTRILADEPADGGVTVPADCPLVVTVYWDSGERYVSTGLFDRED